MKTAKFYSTKRNTYCSFGGEIFIKNGHDYSNANFRLATEDEKLRFNPEYMSTIGEFETIEESYQGYIGVLESGKQERLIENAERAERFRIEREADNAKLKAIIEAGPIPATVENIRLLLHWLNDQNWGGWRLPAMTISYSAHQYDCDGNQASTIKLDKPISDEELGINNETMFKVGGKRGHLEKYQSI